MVKTGSGFLMWASLFGRNGLFVLAALASVARAADPASAFPDGPPEDFLVEESEPAVEEVANPQGLTAIAEFLEAAAQEREHGRFKEAEQLYIRALKIPVENAAKRNVVLELARLYEENDSLARAAGQYKQFLELYPDDPERSEVQYQLGILHRDMGLDEEALEWFYSVLTTVVALERDQIPAYRKLTRKAQFEIAKTWFHRRDYERARTFFSRINLLDLGEGDREAVSFYLIKSYARGGEYEQAISSLEDFIEAYPESALLPEALFLLADSLSTVDRTAEAEEVLLRLLDRGSAGGGIHGEAWDYWRRRAGNHFANRFYEEGEIFSALQIYQAIAELSDDPAWRWSTVYQIGLCLERLRHDQRAAEAYTYIVSEAETLQEEAEIGLELENLMEMAKWRLDVLDWTGDVRERFQQIISTTPVESSDETRITY